MLCLYKSFSLCEGENNFAYHEYALFAHKNVLFNYYEEEGSDFYQFYISIADCIFHEGVLEKICSPSHSL